MDLSNLTVFTTKTIRFILSILNFFFLVIGLLLIINGSISVSSNNDIDELFHFNIVGVFCILIGLSIFAVTFFGCCGACYENYSMLYTYGILLSVLLLFQLISFGIAEYLHTHSDGQFVRTKVENFFMKYNSSTIIDRTVDSIQKDLQCCGVEGPDFWKHINLPIPKSCYSNNNTDNQDHLYHKSCLNAIKDEIKKFKFLLPYIVWSLIIQILVIGATFYLAKKVKSGAYDYEAI